MKKYFSYALGLLVVALAFSSCNNDEKSAPVISSILPVADTTINVGSEISFSAVIESDNAFDYSWRVNGTEKSTETLFVFTPEISGEYTVTLYIENKYGNDSLETVVHVLPKVLTADFESLSLTGLGYWNGSDGSGSFTSGLLSFENSFNVSWGSWSGFVYSNLNDTVTSGYVNQYSVYDASNQENKFAVYYYGMGEKATFSNNEAITILSMKICNSTYAALSMLNGDSYAKKFGGTSGTDSDYLKVTINGLDKNNNVVGSVDFYLADYRSATSSEDYVVDHWTEVDLSSLGAIYKLSFSMESTDTGTWGINTPTYFCIDDIKYYDPEN
jgi:PKD repeat protein